MALRTWSWARVAMAGRRVGAREDWRARTIWLVPGAAQCQLPERGEGKLPGASIRWWGLQPARGLQGWGWNNDGNIMRPTGVLGGELGCFDNCYNAFR